MASCFKISCGVYWVACFFYISYMVGIGYYVSAYICPTEEVLKAEFFIFFMCTFNIAFAVTGCIYVKCNIVHIFYAMTFLGPLLFVNVGTTVVGVLALRTASSSFPSLHQVRDNFASGPYKNWFDKFQDANGCCGFLGYVDYLAFANSKQSESLSDYIPRSCCKSKNEKCHLKLDSNETSPVQNTTLELALDLHLLCANKIDDYKELYDDPSDSRKFSPNPYLEDVIHKCGCQKSMTIVYQHIYDSSHIIFYIVSGVLVFFMTIMYIRNWFLAHNVVGGNTSTHSLDIDEDIPYVTSTKILEIQKKNQEEPLIEGTPSQLQQVRPQSTNVGAGEGQHAVIPVIEN